MQCVCGSLNLVKSLKLRFFCFLNFIIGLFLLTCVSFSSSADDKTTIELVAGLPKPPFIIEKNKSGIQIDLVREAFRLHGKKVKFVHLPLGRAITGYQRLNVDGVMTLPANYQHPAMKTSSPYVTYQNVAVTLAENEAVIKTVKDLSRLSMVAFQNASRYLGEEFNDVISHTIDYREMPDQAKQVEMLFMRRTEVIVLDESIFKYLISQSNDIRLKKPFKIHYIFNERNYVAGFRDAKLVNMFNDGIAKMKEQGTYQQIIDKYLH